MDLQIRQLSYYASDNDNASDADGGNLAVGNGQEGNNNAGGEGAAIGNPVRPEFADGYPGGVD